MTHIYLYKKIFPSLSRNINFPDEEDSNSGARRRKGPVPPTVAASMVLGEVDGRTEANAQQPTNLEECIICLERKPEVILPCAHAYCTPCIEQWWEYCIPKEDECASALSVYAM